MLLIEARCEPTGRVDARLILPFELRQKSRLRAHLDSGEEVGVFLERGAVLRDGECLRASDGRVVQVVAAREQVMRATSKRAGLLLRAAYHLGNRHVALQISERWLRFERDEVLKDMLVGLGLEVREELAPFEPEAGAYMAAHGHEPVHAEGRHGQD
jgi:urease accessory protein